LTQARPWPEAARLKPAAETADEKTGGRTMTEDIQDSLTGVWSRFGLLFFVEHYLKLLRRVKREMTLFVVGVDGLPADGADGAWAAAHEANLKEAARLLRRTFRTSDAVARIGPDLFAVLLLETSDLGADILLTRLEDRLAEWKAEHPDLPPLTLSLVVDRIRADQEMTFAAGRPTRRTGTDLRPRPAAGPPTSCSPLVNPPAPERPSLPPPGLPGRDQHTSLAHPLLLVWSCVQTLHASLETHPPQTRTLPESLAST
jgi:diguanylate cyclase (GGDEF)-like protein